MSNLFSERFKEIIRQKNIKVSWLAGELGVTNKSVYGFMNGEIYPSTETLIKIAECLGVSLDYLTGRINEPTKFVLMQEDDDLRESIFFINESYRKMDETERRIIYNLIKSIREEKENDKNMRKAQK